MALEDIAMFRAVHGAYVFYPSDAVSMERAVELSANTEGICFIRSSRPATPVIYKNDEVFEIGKAKVIALYTYDSMQRDSRRQYRIIRYYNNFGEHWDVFCRLKYILAR